MKVRVSTEKEFVRTLRKLSKRQRATVLLGCAAGAHGGQSAVRAKTEG